MGALEDLQGGTRSLTRTDRFPTPKVRGLREQTYKTSRNFHYHLRSGSVSSRSLTPEGRFVRTGNSLLKQLTDSECPFSVSRDTPLLLPRPRRLGRKFHVALSPGVPTEVKGCPHSLPVPYPVVLSHPLLFQLMSTGYVFPYPHRPYLEVRPYVLPYWGDPPPSGTPEIPKRVWMDHLFFVCPHLHLLRCVFVV